MPRARVTITTERPQVPQPDFAFHIDFKKGVGSASRVFLATHEFIRACEKIDRELASSVDASIETVMVLEDVEASSLKTFFRTVLRSADDQGLKNLNWKPFVGKYLVDAKYLLLQWLESDDPQRKLPELVHKIHEQASETDVRNIPYYSPVNAQEVIEAAKDFDRIKDHLVSGDEASMIVSDEKVAHFNVTSRLDIGAIEDLAVSKTEVHSVPNMVVFVKKPDYLGYSMWEFRHGKRPISAKIEDEQWLQRFQNRGVDVRPGDALRCRVRVVLSYGFDNELLDEKHYIEEVHDVLENRYRQGTLGLNP